jgi:hypothetical protein
MHTTAAHSIASPRLMLPLTRSPEVILAAPLVDSSHGWQWRQARIPDLFSRPCRPTRLPDASYTARPTATSAARMVSAARASSLRLRRSRAVTACGAGPNSISDYGDALLAPEAPEATPRRTLVRRSLRSVVRVILLVAAQAALEQDPPKERADKIRPDPITQGNTRISSRSLSTEPLELEMLK